MSYRWIYYRSGKMNAKEKSHKKNDAKPFNSHVSAMDKM